MKISDTFFIIFVFLSVSYFLAFIFSIFEKISKSLKHLSLSVVSFYFGFFTHTFCLVYLSYFLDWRIPLLNSFQLLYVIIWIFAFLKIFLRNIFRVEFLNMFASVFASIFTALPLFCPEFKSEILYSESMGDLIVTIHSIVATISYAMMWITSIMGIIYWMQINSIKKKWGFSFFRDIIPLESLEKILYMLLLITLGTLFSTIIFGIVSVLSYTRKVENLYLMVFPTIILFLIYFTSLIFYVKSKVTCLSLAKISVISGIVSLFCFALIVVSML